MITYDTNPILWKMRLNSVSTDRRDTPKTYQAPARSRVDYRLVSALAGFALPLVVAGANIFGA